MLLTPGLFFCDDEMVVVDLPPGDRLYPTHDEAIRIAGQVTQDLVCRSVNRR